jgi:hypothetical protein
VRRLLAAIVSALVAAGCVSADESAPRNGELVGRVALAPACPGPAQPDRPCPPQPIQASVDVYPADADQASAAPARSVSTDASGRFRIALPPGKYQLVPRIAAAGAASGKTANATVGAGAATEVQLIIDTGMR